MCLSTLIQIDGDMGFNRKVDMVIHTRVIKIYAVLHKLGGAGEVRHVFLCFELCFHQHDQLPVGYTIVERSWCTLQRSRRCIEKDQ